MYRQISVDSRNCDYQRILWNGNDSRKIRDYQLVTVMYGTASAPFLALRTLKQLVQDEGEPFPLAAPILHDNIYVDDLLFGAEDMPLLCRAREQVCDLLARGAFTPRKCASNNPELLENIPAEDHGLACSKDLRCDDRLSILGICWNPTLDSFQFRVSLSPRIPDTKRTILSAIAQIFDSFWCITPSTVAAKIFMQHLWHLKVDWDDPIPSAVIPCWSAIYHDLFCLSKLRIPR